MRISQRNCVLVEGTNGEMYIPIDTNESTAFCVNRKDMLDKGILKSRLARSK
jgi:hypothetical protein